MNEHALNGILSAAALLLTVLVILFYSRLQLELKSLVSAVRILTRTQRAPEGVHFKTKGVSDVWRLLLALVSHGRGSDRGRPTVEEVLTLSSKITGMSDELSSVAREVGELVLGQTRPDVIAVAVVLRNGESGELALEYVQGLPEKRLRSTLLSYFDCLIDASNEEETDVWGYQVAADAGTMFDLRVFGIGMSLAVPLRDSSGICGGLWLGLKASSTSLGAQRKAFVHAIAEHAAASFYAAKKVREKSMRTSQERDFLLGLSHDLRAPGNTALYALKDLMSGELGALTSEQHLRLSTVEHALEDQLAILGDVLDFAKHQKGFLQAKRTRAPLSRIVLRTLESFVIPAEERGLAFSWDAVPESTVEVDPRHLQRILANFLSNAIKYAPSGGDGGSVRAAFLTTPTHIEIQIIDSGPGISETEQKLLFTEFQRLGNNPDQQGYGLGLALSKALADLNDAYVSYTPNPKRGSIFSVGIRLARTDGIESSLSTLNLGRVLVVDDDSAACRANIRYLSGIADTLTPASSVASALELCKDWKPDLVVTDLNLGDGSALSLLERLEEARIVIPTIVITGAGYGPQFSELTKRSHVTILEKPVSRAHLQQAVASLVS